MTREDYRLFLTSWIRHRLPYLLAYPALALFIYGLSYLFELDRPLIS